MTSPRAVVIPFGVPEDGRGLGLGLAALVHSFAQIAGESVALAQLLSKKSERPSDPNESQERIIVRDEASPVEAFVPPQAWKDLTGPEANPDGVSVVVTGAFEPPVDGRGLIQLLVFDAKNGRTKARVEATVDGENAGKSLLGAFAEAWSQIDGELGTVRDIDGLSWDALESVLRAERCALHDPMRGGPHDRLAALVHLGRAIGDAPDARLPASRLASLALDVAVAGVHDLKLEGAAQRALVRALSDSPRNADLLEALTALSLRANNPADAIIHAEMALTIDPSRGRIYALLSEARRSSGDLAGALTAIEDGLLASTDDPLLHTERGLVLAERGDVEAAAIAWRMVLDRRPLYPPAYTNLAAHVMAKVDTLAAARLVDDALSHSPAHPDVLRRAIQLSLAAEPDGIARASRVTRLAEQLIQRTPNDAWVNLVLARSLAQTGDRLAASRRLAQVEELAPGSTFASEAQRGRFALAEPKISQEMDALLRAAHQAAPDDLETIATRAKRLAIAHAMWLPWYAVGIAERRRERWREARDAFGEAIRLSPGCTAAHLEIVGAHVALGASDIAIVHARKACGLEGDTARTLAVLATALLAADNRDEAAIAIDRALALDSTDEANRALAERIHTGRPGTLARVREIFRWRRRSDA